VDDNTRVHFYTALNSKQKGNVMAEDREQIGLDDFVVLEKGKTSGALYWNGVRLSTVDDLAEIKHQLDVLREQLQNTNVKRAPPPSLKP
jgi:hypothetical protein